ncbi:Hypothetical predicted protein [Lecanosticta acicola]|uniref:DUF7071 domain-containing protein n=1 Tax=Lecanosticta acicola TaxID=111012 RepID=A0AAI8YVG3_9PEZI|nr:Hypothetical predicted protein [Lecanosticta acicola]
MKGDRDLVGIERSLGLRSVRGISRQANKDAPPIRSLLEGIRIIAQAYVTRSNGEIRSSQVLKDDAHDLLEQYGPDIWPGPEHERPPWLEEPSTTNFDGKYPQHRYYTDPADREFLNNTFYQLVVEKCCNYHDNQLQKHRRSSAKNTAGQDTHSASGTPRQGEYADEAESESEYLTAHAPPAWPAVNDPVARRVLSSAPPPAISPPSHHASELAPHGLPSVYVFGSNGHPAADTMSPAVKEMSPIPRQPRPSPPVDSHVHEDSYQVPEQDRDGDEVMPDSSARNGSVSGDEENEDYLGAYKRKRTGSIESDRVSKRSRIGSVSDERASLIVTLKANPDELLRISKRSRKTLYNNNFLDYYTRDSSPEETSSRRSVRSLRSERQSTIHSTPGPELRPKQVIQVQQYKDRRGKWYEVDTEIRPDWAVEERTVTREIPQERRRSAWVKRHGPISPNSVNAASEKARSDDLLFRGQADHAPRSGDKMPDLDEASTENEPSVNGRKGSHAGTEDLPSSGKSGLLSPSKSPGPFPPKRPDVQDNARHLPSVFGDQHRQGSIAENTSRDGTERDMAPPPLTGPTAVPFTSTATEGPRETSSSPVEAGADFPSREAHTITNTSPDQRAAASEPPARFVVPDRPSRPTSRSDAGPQLLQHVFKARGSEPLPGLKSRVMGGSENSVPPLSIIRARDPEEDERAQARLGAFRPSAGDGQFIHFTLPQQGKENGARREEDRPQARSPPRKPDEQQLKASATPEMTSSETFPASITQPQQPKRSIQPASLTGVPPAPPNYATPKALVEEVLGGMAVYPTVQYMLTTFPTLSKIELQNLKRIVSHDQSARNDWRALQRYLRAEIMYGPLDTVDFGILQSYVYNPNAGPPPPELQSLFSKQGGPTRSLPSNSTGTPRQQPAVPTPPIETKSATTMKHEVIRPLTIQSVAPIPSTRPPPPLPAPVSVPSQPAEATKSEPPESKGNLTSSAEDESLSNTFIEINWGHPTYEFGDHAELRDFKNCRTAAEFFGRIEAKIPDELVQDGKIIREIRIKAVSELKGAMGRMPRFLRDDGGVRAGWRQLMKILRAQPVGTEAELEFSIIWGER